MKKDFKKNIKKPQEIAEPLDDIESLFFTEPAEPEEEEAKPPAPKTASKKQPLPYWLQNQDKIVTLTTWSELIDDVKLLLRVQGKPYNTFINDYMRAYVEEHADDLADIKANYDTKAILSCKSREKRKKKDTK